jgi:hypothetical protein
MAVGIIAGTRMRVENQKTFVIVTTWDLPEAYVLARYLCGRGQRVAILNSRGRPLIHRMRVLRRLWKNRGSLYVLDHILARLFYSYYVSSEIVPFPELDSGTIGEIRKACICFDCDDLHDAEAVQFVANLAPDYLLIAGAPVIRPMLYSLAREATLNRHLGLAPAYRGSNCPIWALAGGDFQSVGYTIHLVSERVDGGGIVRQAPIPMRRDVSLAEYLAEVQVEGSNGFVSVLSDILEGLPLRPKTQQGAGMHFPPAGLSAVRRAYRNYNRERQQRAANAREA